MTPFTARKSSGRPECSSNSNSFSFLDGESEDFDKENVPLNTYGRPTFKVAEALIKKWRLCLKIRKLALRVWVKLLNITVKM